ncbi:MAG: pyruvate kinase [Clostridia bacterium]|nr:pyruvate kinase [Clostridia bacterium]
MYEGDCPKEVLITDFLSGQHRTGFFRELSEVSMVKIYGTFGPSCQSQGILEKMIQEGVDGMRLNLSHTSLEESRFKIKHYRACTSRPEEREIIIDLHGPEIRTGYLKSAVTLSEGTEFILKSKKTGETLPVVSVPPVFLEALEPGDEILFRDGQIKAQVVSELEPSQSEAETEETEKGRFRRFLCRSTQSGIVNSLQTVKIIGKEVYGSTVTTRDHENLALAKELGITGIMQPFVRGSEDIQSVREAMELYGLDLRIFAKIESETGLRHLDSIIESADVIVIARGDLGNAVPLWELPRIQKEIAAKCLDAGKPFMVVTQMLDSMIRKPIPTRAELTDIFNAVMDGASYVMVTSETSVGKYPVDVIRYLSRTVREAESYRKAKMPAARVI